MNLGKIIRRTAVGALIAAVALPGVVIADRYTNRQAINPSVFVSDIDTGRAVSLPPQIIYKLKQDREYAWNQLKAAHVDPLAQASSADLEKILTDALPVIADVTGLYKLNVPNLTTMTSRPNKGFYNPLTNEVVIDKSISTFFDAKYFLPHEFHHAQGFNMDETAAVIVSWEVLARQALAGDMLARYVLSYDLTRAFQWKEDWQSGKFTTDVKGVLNWIGISGIITEGTKVTYYAEPASVLSERLESGNLNYNGIPLNGLASFLSRIAVASK